MNLARPSKPSLGTEQVSEQSQEKQNARILLPQVCYMLWKPHSDAAFDIHVHVPTGCGLCRQAELGLTVTIKLCKFRHFVQPLCASISSLLKWRRHCFYLQGPVGHFLSQYL